MIDSLYLCQMPPHVFERNPGIPLDLGWVERVQVNKPALDRRAATHLTRRTGNPHRERERKREKEKVKEILFFFN